MARLLHAVVCPLERLPRGATFPRRDWPLHVTVLGNFAWDGDLARLLERVAVVVDGRAPIDVVVGEEAMFGTERTIAVNTLVPHPGLAALHDALIDDRMTFVEPQFLRAGYRAHITHFPAGRRYAADVVRLPQVVLAELAGDAASIRAVWDWD